MKIDISKLTIKDLAHYICNLLTENKIDVVLVGGACVSIYSKNKYMSYDLDFVTDKTLKEICNNKYFKEGIKKSNYDSLSLTRKITLFTIKNKLYLLTGAICKYRQKQNRKS